MVVTKLSDTDVQQPMVNTSVWWWWWCAPRVSAVASVWVQSRSVPCSVQSQSANSQHWHHTGHGGHSTHIPLVPLVIEIVISNSEHK